MKTIQLSDEELQDAAEAARLASIQAEEEAEKQASPRMRSMWDGCARRWRELAGRFEGARGRFEERVG